MLSFFFDKSDNIKFYKSKKTHKRKTNRKSGRRPRTWNRDYNASRNTFYSANSYCRSGTIANYLTRSDNFTSFEAASAID